MAVLSVTAYHKESTMIVRKRKINSNAKEVAVQISYGLPDIKAMLQEYFMKFEAAGGQLLATTVQHDERDFIHYFHHGPFKNYPDSLAESLSKWVFVQGVKAGYIVQSELNKNTFFLSEMLGRRIGRPRKQEE